LRTSIWFQGVNWMGTQQRRTGSGGSSGICCLVTELCLQPLPDLPRRFAPNARLAVIALPLEPLRSHFNCCPFLSFQGIDYLLALDLPSRDDFRITNGGLMAFPHALGLNPQSQLMRLVYCGVGRI